MTPQQLKNSILQRAIEGRLVEQRPEEGNAKELLKEIQVEKARLVEEGKIKKPKVLPPITEEEKPFDIPEGWEWVRWGDLSQSIQYGYNAPAQTKGRIKMVRISDIQDNRVLWETVPYCQIDEENIETYALQTNDILFARTGGTVGKSYLVTEVPEEAIYAGYLIRTRYSNLLVPQYLKFFMESSIYWEQLRNGTIATAQPNCNGKTLGNMILPFPPLAEQRRIVAKIEEILPLIDKYDKAYTKLTDFNTRFPEAMKKSLLQYAIQGKLVEQRADEGTAQDLIKDIQAEKKRLIAEKKIKKPKVLPPITEEEIPFDIPEGWDWVRLGEIGDWGSGATPKRHHPEYYGGDIPWLKTGDLNDGYISEIPETITQEGFDNSSVRLNPVGSVLMAMYGATIGKLGILTVPATTNQACCACALFAEMNPQYLFYYLMSQRTNFIKLGEGGAQPNISKEKIVNFLFPMPPLAEQHRIVAKLEELLPFCDQLRSKSK
ncbi:type I restriction enzyme, S subunit [Selenomonas sp. GACV-9]|uniref:restriction endonuclease subunit S n=1 Tax=Selenomonas sp. GACV-9 TaxID=3158782 RepID=UPI0008E638F2|nr:type I restriction enzyme, S subunit [Selenomonas ruminantium]